MPLAVAWCCAGEPIELSEIENTTDLRLAGSIVNDLLRMS